MNKTYFNNNNGNTYEVLAHYFDEAMYNEVEELFKRLIVKAIKRDEF